jgi:hypothetical protein
MAAQPTEIKVVQNDKLGDLKFTLQNADGTAFDLTNSTSIKLKVQKQGDTALKFTGTMALDGGATLGKVKYTVQAGDFDVAGRHYAEIEITFTSAQIITFPDIFIEVLPELPRS